MAQRDTHLLADSPTGQRFCKTGHSGCFEVGIKVSGGQGPVHQSGFYCCDKMPGENTLKELRFILDKCSRNFNHDGSALWARGEAKDNGSGKTSSGP